MKKEDILNTINAQKQYCNKLGFKNWSEFSLMIKQTATNSLEWIKSLDAHEKQALKDYENTSS